MPILHYIYDPLCGWCYGAASLISALRELPGLQVRLHAGGMMTGAQRRPVTPELRSYVLGHDERIAQITGQEFGAAYRDGLLNDATVVLDSEPPITAILAVDALGGDGLAYLKTLQLAHYRDGLKIADPAVLEELALSLGLEIAAFRQVYAAQAGAATAAHIRASRDLLAQVGGRGFPTLALETAEGWRLLDVSAGLADPQGFARNLAQSLPAANPDFMCGLDGVCN